MNGNRVCLLLFAILLPITTLADDDDLYAINRLREDLIYKQKYDRWARPVKHHATTTNVKASFYISSITDLDLKTEILTTNGVVILKWKDEHLVWNPSSYAGLNQMILTTKEAWTPDFTHWNSAWKSQMSNSLDNQPITVKSDGSVEWWPSATFYSVCRIDLTNYPWDSQNCNLYFGTWANNQYEVNLTVNSDASVWGPNVANPEWKVTSRSLTSYVVSDWSALNLRLGLERRTSMYRYYVVIPYAVATLCALTMFTLPIHSQIRLVFASLSIVILILLMMFVSTIVGTHSIRVPYAVKCIGINILLVGISLIATQINQKLFSGLSFDCPQLVVNVLSNPILNKVLFLGPTTKQGPQAMASGESRLVDGDSEVNHSSSNNQGQLGASSNFRDKEHSSDWSLVASFFDRVLFATYAIAMLAYHS